MLLRAYEPFIVLLLLHLDDVDAQTLLGCGIDLPEESHSLVLVVDLRDDLSPRFGRQHVSEAIVDADRLDLHDTRSVSGLELQELTGLQALDVVVADANLEGLATGHDRVEVRTLDTQLAHGVSFLVKVESPLLDDTVGGVSTREHAFERPSMTLQAANLPRFGNQMGIQLVAVVHQQSLKVDDERFERLFGRRHEGHQLDRRAFLGRRTRDTDHIASALSHEDDLVFRVHIGAIPPLVAGEKGVDPVVVYASEDVTHLREDQASHAIGVLFLLERNHRDVGRLVPRLVAGLFVEHVLVDALLVVVLRRTGDAEALPEEELQCCLVRRCDSAVQLSGTDTASEVLGVLEEHASDTQPATVVRADNQRTDLHRLLLLLDDVDDADPLAVQLGDEHVLPSREVTDMVDATFHVRIEDSLRVSVVVSPIERAQSPDHEIRHPLEVTSRRRADDNRVADR